MGRAVANREMGRTRVIGTGAPEPADPPLTQRKQERSASSDRVAESSG